MSWQRFLEPPAWESLGGRYPVMPMGRCFINAYRLTRCFPELRYVEGEAEPFFDPNAAEPGPHA
jgi:hypothetical protein